MAYSHAVVWLDHTDAHVIHLDESTHAAQHVRSPHGKEHLHHKHGVVGSGHATAHGDFYDLVMRALGESGEILVCGPASAKQEFVKHAGTRNAAFAKRILGTETLDHPSEGQIVAFARKYFLAADRMR